MMKHIAKYLLSMLILLALQSNLLAQQNKAPVFAAYVNNFIKYTTWQNENQLDSFRILVVSDNKEIKNEFLKFSKGRKARNKPVSLIVSPIFLKSYRAQLIVLTQEKSELLVDIYNAIEAKPVLLVSENYAEKRNVMINLIQTLQNEIKFEINQANIINQNLTIDPEILLSGGTNIDVAALYRKSQISMRDMQKTIDDLDDSLKNIKQHIQNATALIKSQEKEIANQQQEIKNKQELIAKQMEDLKSFEKLVITQKELLESQKDSVLQKGAVLKEQQEEILRNNQEIQSKLDEVQSKQELIEELNKQLESKNIALGAQSETISRQSIMIYSFIIIAVLVVFLIISLFVGYHNNKQKSKKLALQKIQIEEKLNELELLNQKLIDSDQYKSIFLASMSHELRTPLNSIIGYTGILLMGLAGELNNEQKLQLTKVKNNGSHLLSLINDVLDISKIEADKVELDFGEFELKEFVNEIADIVKPKADEKNLVLNIDIIDNVWLFTDRRRLKQVLLNLVSNAVNYTNDGSVLIKTEKINNENICIAVIDTGIGIDDQEMARLFQPFQQIDSSLTKHNKGTGLGLYLCKKLMKLLDGDIYARSSKGFGSTFSIEIPFHKHIEV